MNDPKWLKFYADILHGDTFMQGKVDRPNFSEYMYDGYLYTYIAMEKSGEVILHRRRPVWDDGHWIDDSGSFDFHIIDIVHDTDDVENSLCEVDAVMRYQKYRADLYYKYCDLPQLPSSMIQEEWTRTIDQDGEQEKGYCSSGGFNLTEATSKDLILQTLNLLALALNKATNGHEQDNEQWRKAVILLPWLEYCPKCGSETSHEPPGWNGESRGRWVCEDMTCSWQGIWYNGF